MSDTIQDLEHIFHPARSASSGPPAAQAVSDGCFLEGMIRMGFPAIFPVHPTEKTLLGLKAFPNIKKFD